MKSPLWAAVVQLHSGLEPHRNLCAAVDLVRGAAEAGARLICLPENYGFLGGEREKLAHAQGVDGAFTAALADVCRERGVWVLAGSIPEATEDPNLVYNTSVLLSPAGEVAAVYRKIHLFDVDVPGAVFRESAHVRPGEQIVVADVEGWKVGLSVCYDLRFPELYRSLVAQGAEVLTVPAAFTLQTGKDHWLPLLRARAIENQCFVLAPGQWGVHAPERITWGKSCIIDPWGALLATHPEGVGFAMARLDPEGQTRVRAQVPCLAHRRL